MKTRSIALAAPLALLLAAISVPSAQALPLNDFDAPLLGTTATAQLTRMPTLEQVTCSDANCTTGLYPETALRSVEYSTKTVMPDAGYTRVPEFLRGVLVNWTDLTAAEGSSSFASFVIAEYQPGSDMRKVMTDTAALSGTTLTERVINGQSIFVGETVNEREDENNFSGTAFKSVFILGIDSLIRAGCQAGGSAVQTSRCTVEGLIPLALSIANTSPSKKLIDAAQLESLAPEALPKALQPLVVASVGNDQAWATESSNKKLLSYLNGKPTAFAQYTIEGSPRMNVYSRSSKIGSQSVARGFIERACQVSDDEASCRDRKIAGGRGVATTYIDDRDQGGVVEVTVRGTSRDSLILFGCFKRSAVSGFLSKAEVAKCTALGATILTNANR